MQWVLPLGISSAVALLLALAAMAALRASGTSSGAGGSGSVSDIAAYVMLAPLLLQPLQLLAPMTAVSLEAVHSLVRMDGLGQGFGSGYGTDNGGYTYDRAQQERLASLGVGPGK